MDCIIQQFHEVGITNIKPDFAAKCAELCETYGMSPSDMAEEFIAFTVSSGLEQTPSVDILSQMVKKKCFKINPKALERGKPLAVYNTPGVPQLLQDIPDDLREFDDADKENVESAMKTPKSNRHAKPRSNIAFTSTSPRTAFSPASFSPITIAPSQMYEGRVNAGKVMCTFGNKVSHAHWTSKGATSLKLQFPEEFPQVADNVCYMFELPSDKVLIQRKRADMACRNIVTKHSLYEPHEVWTASQEKCVFVGRICCENEGRLTANTIQLEGTNGTCVPVNVSELPGYSLFPGQAVAIEGKNPNGRRIIAEKIYHDVCLPPALHPKLEIGTADRIEIIVAAGPFTLSNTLSYQPLGDLVQYALNHSVDALILIGPLVDSLHSHVVDGSMAETFFECYTKILREILEKLKHKKTKVILVSSWREAGSHPIFPTPCARIDNLRKTYPNLSVASDPTVIHVSGITIGLTATDVLMHLGREEISWSRDPSMDRLGRLASHVLQQGCFYPLMPPPDDMSVDFTLWSLHAHLPYIPHILILPSDLRCFAKLINGCVVVNPEKLSKGQTGGSFARIEVATSSDPWKTEDNISVEVLKI